MGTCACGDDFASIFDRRAAERDRDRYRLRGPDRTTRMLLEMIIANGVVGATVLDVGGGIGVIDQELLRAGADRALLVDAARAYVDVAREGAGSAGVSDRIAFIEGDFVHRAGDIAAADVVTLDRVVCCYPDVGALVSASADRARRLYGLVLPRDGWHARLAVRLVNLAYRVRRSPYRAYAHPNDRIDRLLADRGLVPALEGRTLAWRVVLYERTPMAPIEVDPAPPPTVERATAPGDTGLRQDPTPADR